MKVNGSSTKSEVGSQKSLKSNLVSPSIMKGTNKGIGKGRTCSKQLSSSSKVGDTYALQFQNALPIKQTIWGRDPNTNEWRFCSIIHARKRKDIADTISNTDIRSHHYDYYVHFLGFDRRMDCWLSWEEIRQIDDDSLSKEGNLKLNDHASDDEHAGLDEEYLREHEENTKVKTIGKLRIGSYLVDTWYFSPYPKEFQDIDTLNMCEFCLSFFKEESEMIKHTQRCQIRHPPGNEIYRDGNISMFELDGKFARIFCENLCYLSKLFLDHKTLRHPVNLFLFYVMTEVDSTGYHITGYFSKEKYSKNNVSCILTLPQHQRKGYGKFLIGFSYALSKKENKTGTPERPLSDLGKASYMAYWSEKLLDILLKNPGPISIQDLSDMTCMETSDIISCLEENGMLKYISGGEYILLIPSNLGDFIRAKSGKSQRPIIMENLHWTPYDQFVSPYEYNPQA